MDYGGNGIDFRRQWRGVYSQLLRYGTIMWMRLGERIVGMRCDFESEVWIARMLNGEFIGVESGQGCGGALQRAF